MENKELIRQLLEREHYDFEDLVSVVRVLRGEGGCPWDREQTHKSIRNDIIEETYEVIEAIDKKDPELLREELGDVLLQVAMHAEMEREEGRCTFDDVANDVCKKMIHRHPHVFGDVKAETSDEVLSNWEVIKSEEKKRESITDKLNAIPRQFPALMRAQKVGKKASMFDFPDAESVAVKVEEELAEVRAALASGNEEQIAEEIGDLLLSVTSLARKSHVNAEMALSAATDKFIARFSAVEEAIGKAGKSFEELSDEELDVFWQNCKNIIKK